MRTHPRTASPPVVVAAALACALLAACRREPPPPVAHGDAGRGHDVIAAYHCGACHTIPGVIGANGRVGPPLEAFGARTFIAGEMPNTPDNLVRWVRDPRGVAPRTAMPGLGLDEQEARDVAAYLYTLR
jgi:cytochrome c1